MYLSKFIEKKILSKCMYLYMYLNVKNNYEINEIF